MAKRKERHVAYDQIKALRDGAPAEGIPAAPLPTIDTYLNDALEKLVRVGDGFENLVSNLGTDKDKASANGYALSLFDPKFLETMYRSSWIGRKIVDIPTEDMTRSWRQWDVDDAIKTKISTAEAKFGVREYVAEAKRLSRLFGSAAIIMGVKQNMDKPEEPIDFDALKPGDLTYLHVSFAPFLSIFQWEDDVASANFGKPKLYHYSPMRHRTGGVFLRVHASRVIPFSGTKLPPFAALAGNTWGDSVFQALIDTATTASSITAAIASLVHESKVDIFKVQNLAAYLQTEDGEKKLLKRFMLAAMLKSMNNALLLDANEDYDQKQINFSGLSDVHVRILQEVAGAADIPATRFLSQSPAGMSSTGESDLRNYYDHIAAKQETDLRQRLDILDRVMFASEGIKIAEGQTYKFPPLWQETPTQKATNALAKANATKAYHDTGLIDDEVLAEGVISQLIEDGLYPALAAAVKKSKTNGIGNGPDSDANPGDLQPGPGERAAMEQNAKGGGRGSMKDAAPRTLYVSRRIENAADLIAWAKSQGFKSTLPADDLHVTIAFSRAPVDWMKAGADDSKIIVPAGGPRLIETFGGGAVVLLFDCWSLKWRWDRFKDIGASWDWPEYQPHITLTYDPGDVDLDDVEPYQGEIVLGPERFAEVDENWKAKVAETE